MKREDAIEYVGHHVDGHTLRVVKDGCQPGGTQCLVAGHQPDLDWGDVEQAVRDYLCAMDASEPMPVYITRPWERR